MTGDEHVRGQLAGKVAVVTGGSRGYRSGHRAGTGRPRRRHSLQLPQEPPRGTGNPVRSRSLGREVPESPVASRRPGCHRLSLRPDRRRIRADRHSGEQRRVRRNAAGNRTRRPALGLDPRHQRPRPVALFSRGCKADAPWRENHQHIEPRRNQGPHQLLCGRGLKGGAGSRHEVPGNGTVPRAASA